MSNRACNLLAKDMLRAALADEIEEHGPQVALVGGAELLSGTAEWLTGAAPGPNRSSCWPACKLQSKGPSGNSTKPVALHESADVLGLNFCD